MKPNDKNKDKGLKIKRGVWLPFEKGNYYKGDVVVCINVNATINGMYIPLIVAAYDCYCETFPGGEKVIPTHIMYLPKIPKRNTL